MDAPDPNEFPIPRWATYIPHRASHIKFKQHTSLGLAKTALSAQIIQSTGRYAMDAKGRQHYEHQMTGGWIYELIDDQWILRHTIEPGTFKSEHPLWQAAYVIREEPELR